MEKLVGNLAIHEPFAACEQFGDQFRQAFSSNRDGGALRVAEACR
jgi:hypothetical protein